MCMSLSTHWRRQEPFIVIATTLPSAFDWLKNVTLQQLPKTITHARCELSDSSGAGSSQELFKAMSVFCSYSYIDRSEQLQCTPKFARHAEFFFFSQVQISMGRHKFKLDNSTAGKENKLMPVPLL